VINSFHKLRVNYFKSYIIFDVNIEIYLWDIFNISSGVQITKFCKYSITIITVQNLSYTLRNFSRKINQKFVFIYLFQVHFAFTLTKFLCRF